MTTLAIIGSGIMGRSLIYTLAKERKSFERIVVFESDNFAAPCSLNSTAIVAPRGLSKGHSPLGDQLLEAFHTFSEHVRLDGPAGIETIVQYTATTSKEDEFKKRYPKAEFGKFMLRNQVLMAQDEAYLIDPKTYCNWLLEETRLMDDGRFELIDDFVTEVGDGERTHLKTQAGRTLLFDKVVFCGGNYNRFWRDLLPQSKLKSTRPVQGSYLEFNDVHFERDSFSLTLDGDNLIWNRPLKRLLVGSTTDDTGHLLPSTFELKSIYERLRKQVDFDLPEFEVAQIKVGLREKAQKREPYLIEDQNRVFVGGLYKNGFGLALHLGRLLSHRYL